MSNYEVLLSRQVKKFIEKLDDQRRARIDRIFDLFEEYGQSLSTQYLKKLTKNIWELRPGDVRLFLGMSGNKGFIVHGIKKQTQKIPKKDISLAGKRFKEI